jgi:hypothetical protein
MSDSAYLDLPLRSLRQVRAEAEAEYRRLVQTEAQLTIALWTAADNDRQLIQPRYDACRQQLAALADTLDTLDDEIAHRERAGCPRGL